MSGMNITTFLSFFKIQVLDSKFAGEDVSDDNFIFSFDFGCHFYFYEWQAFNASFLLLEFVLLIRVIRENEFVKCLTLRFLHGAILMK
jgi:hypothetical protein